MNIEEISKEYAVENTNDILYKAIAKAYADGYEKGYNDSKLEAEVELTPNDGVEYVDLGLPSGTLWAADYVREDEKIQFSPFLKAKSMAIPTREQLNELLNYCEWQKNVTNGQLNYALCFGLNGNKIKFMPSGYMKENLTDPREFYFWVNEENERNKATHFNGYIYPNNNSGYDFQAMIGSTFLGYRLPVWLVKSCK